MRKENLFLMLFLLFINSCNNNDNNDLLQGNTSDFEEGAILATLTKGAPTFNLEVEGKSFTIQYIEKNEVNVDSESIALRSYIHYCAEEPKCVKKGKYEKSTYLKNEFTSIVGKHTYALLRADTYEFTINLTFGETSTLSVYTDGPEGFTSPTGGSTGLNIIKKTDKSVTFQFFLLNGAAYNVLGQQLCANKYFPTSPENIKYNYSYKSNLPPIDMDKLIM